MKDTWIKQALNGDISYFSAKSHKESDYTDSFGMTPLMYCLLGNTCRDYALIRKFKKISNSRAKNILGHTAFDIFLIVSGHNFDNKIYDLLAPFSGARKTGKLAGKAFDIVFNELGRQVGLPCNSNLYDTSDSRHHLQNKRKADFLSLSQTLYQIIVSLDKEVQDTSLRYENSLNRISCIRTGYSPEYTEIETSFLYEIISKSELHKSEFENQNDFHERVCEYAKKNRELLLQKHSVKLNDMKTQLLENLRQDSAKLKQNLDELQTQLNGRQLQSKLVEQYIMPDCQLLSYTYDAESEVFQIQLGRYSTSLKLHRDIAKTFKNQQLKYEMSMKPLQSGYEIDIIIDTGTDHFHCEPVLFVLSPWEPSDYQPDLDFFKLIMVLSREEIYSKPSQIKYKNDLCNKIREIDNNQLRLYAKKYSHANIALNTIFSNELRRRNIEI